MGDRRRYTGTQMLQAMWTVFALFVGAIIQFLQPIVGGMFQPVVFLTVSGLWIAGLIVIALYDRYQWNQMVAGSSFQSDTSTRLADLESLKGGRSVVAVTNIPDMLSQTHMELRTPIEGVGASFTIQLTYVEDGSTEDGLQTGNDHLDDSFVIRGTRENVSQLLSPEIQSQLMEIETPGTFTITGEAVEYEIPFTRLSPTELETIADVSLALAQRIEQLAGQKQAA
jgi:hypothetical protein